MTPTLLTTGPTPTAAQRGSHWPDLTPARPLPAGPRPARTPIAVPPGTDPAQGIRHRHKWCPAKSGHGSCLCITGGRR